MRDRGSRGRRAAPADRRLGTRGQALVEFALLIPVMLLLMLVAVDFGRLFFTYVAVSNGAREAANYAAMHAADTDFVLADYQAAVTAAAVAERNVQAQGDEGDLTVSAPVCFEPVSRATLACDLASDYAGGIGNQVTVSVDQPFTFLTPLVGELFGGQLTLSASSTAPVLNPVSPTILADPTPTPSPDPDATPTPTPSPTPVPPVNCTVPDFYHTYWANPGALGVWHDEAGFTGTLTDLTDGKKIQSQTLTAGLTVPCTSAMSVDN